MSCDRANKYEIRHRALLDAVRFFGGVTALSRYLKVTRSRVSNWINQPEIEIPYKYAVAIADITQISIERLSPTTVVANQIMKRSQTKADPMPINMALSEILIGDRPYFKWQKPDRPIIVGTDDVLISGLMQIEAYKTLGTQKMLVMRLDLEAMLSKKQCLKDIPCDFLISEQITIGLRLEQLIGNHQGQRNDLKNVREIGGKNIENSLPLRPLGYEVGRVDSYIAEIIGFKSKNTYRRAKRVCLQGDSELMHAMDRKEILITVAERKIMDPKHFQIDRF